jgi:hypothetical protein
MYNGGGSAVLSNDMHISDETHSASLAVARVLLQVHMLWPDILLDELSLAQAKHICEQHNLLSPYEVLIYIYT